jgi:hypothetical protein
VPLLLFTASIELIDFMILWCVISRTALFLILFLIQTFTWKTDQQSDLARVFALNEQFMRIAATNAPPAKTFTRPKRSRPMKPKAAGGVSKKKDKQ